jgi:hypothetical protein
MFIVSEYGDRQRRLEHSVKLVLYVEVQSILQTGVIAADCFSTVFPVRCFEIFFLGPTYDEKNLPANHSIYSRNMKHVLLLVTSTES